MPSYHSREFEQGQRQAHHEHDAGRGGHVWRGLQRAMLRKSCMGQTMDENKLVQESVDYRLPFIAHAVTAEGRPIRSCENVLARCEAETRSVEKFITVARTEESRSALFNQATYARKRLCCALRAAAESKAKHFSRCGFIS